MLKEFSNIIGVKTRDIGYAGLKDKNAMTMQYISMPKSFEAKLESFSHEKIKILEKHYHNNKLRLGHLKGNRFFIRLKRVGNVEALKIDESLKQIAIKGLPNFFGYQRFGLEGDNYEIGKAIAEGKKRIRDKKKSTFFLNAYQSYLFNNWLSKRIELSHLIESFNVKELSQALPNMQQEELEVLKKQEQFLKLVEGDICIHYPHGRAFAIEDVAADSKRFAQRDISLSGLLAGKKSMRTTARSREYEEAFDADIPANGERRYAWIFPEDVQGKYVEEKAWFELNFTLPKGSYATNVIEELAKQKLIMKEENE